MTIGVVYQNRFVVAAHIVGMIVRDAEVIHLDWAFQYLVLDLLDGDIFAVDELEPVACAEVYRTDPAAVGGVERVSRGRVDLGIAVTP